MRNKRQSSIYLAFVLLVAGTLACNAPTPTTTTSIPQPPPTVTSPAPPASPPPPEPSPEATPTPPEATETPTQTLLPPPTPTQTPPPPTPTTPPPTPTPTPPVSEGPLDFEEPTWIHSWEPLEDGENRAVVVIRITGGAPPFTVTHEHVIVGQTWEREYYIEFLRRGCSGIAYEIIVESADGQSVKKGYWIGGDQQPWCSD